MKKPTDAELRDARADFKALLSRPTTESVWQAFFAVNPFVLSRALPLRLEPCDILPLGRPGRSEPDFLIYPGSRSPAANHGLIELKTPSSRIVTIVRRNLLSLTRDAASAVRQLQVYDREYDRFSPVRRCISFSAQSHLFIIMGLEAELAQLAHDPYLVAQFSQLLPPQVRLLTFDFLLRQYEQGVPLRSFVLVPATESGNARTIAPGDPFWQSGIPMRLRRRELHARFGGDCFTGISLSRQSPNIFLFNRANVGGEYEASWDSDGCFHYPAVGVDGDQQLVGMNRSVLEAEAKGYALRLFSYLEKGEVEYQGRFELDSSNPYYWHPVVDPIDVKRRIVWFRLRPADSERAAA